MIGAGMRIIVAGGSGFIGSALCRALGEAGHDVVLVSRTQRRPPEGVARVAAWGGDWARELEGAGAVVNLAGAGVADGRWSERRKEELRESRLRTTRALVDGLLAAKRKPEVLVSASAVGFYGDRGSERLSEASGPGSGFLAQLCVDWEAEASRAREAGVRTVFSRFAVVLGRDGGALRRMLLPFKLGLGGRLGSGRQYLSWVHLEDAVGLLRLAIEKRELEGPVNVAAPNPVTNAEFSKTLAKVLRRPCLFPVPGFMLRAALGELAEMLLGGQRVEPAAATSKGYAFRYPLLEPALSQLLPR